MKRIVILTGVICLLIIVAMVLFFLFQKQSAKNTQTALQAPIIPKKIENNPLLTFRNSLFGFSYPSTATISQGEGTSNGQIVTVSYGSAQVIIQADSNTTTTLSDAEKILSGYGLSSSPVTIGVRGGIRAVQYSGVVHFGAGDLQKKVALFEQGNTIYRIELSYFSPQIVPQFNALYQEILSTFYL